MLCIRNGKLKICSTVSIFTKIDQITSRVCLLFSIMALQSCQLIDLLETTGTVWLFYAQKIKYFEMEKYLNWNWSQSFPFFLANRSVFIKVQPMVIKCFCLRNLVLWKLTKISFLRQLKKQYTFLISATNFRYSGNNMNPLHVQESETTETVFVIQTCVEGGGGSR
jgi:hypothetical protein